jgi:hypothetical protein
LKILLQILSIFIELLINYFLGKCFQIKTDHQSLKYFLEQHISSPEKQKWVTKLFGKYEDEGSLFSLSFIVPDWLQVVRQEWLHDPKSLHLIQQLQSNSPVSPGYSWLHDEL